MRIAIVPRRSAAIAMFISLGFTFNASAQAPIRAITPYSVRIDNFAKVNDDYYRGGQPLDGHYADLAALGVETVINLTSGEDVRDDEKTMVEKYGMRYLHIPMTTRKAPTDAQIALFMSAVDAEGAVYVHCVGGRHRTGVMTAIYRMTRDGLTGEQAFKEMKQYKYGPDFLHPEFKKFVYEYEPNATVATPATSSSQQ
jgi:protein tyrosine/serine phosphatase